MTDAIDFSNDSHHYYSFVKCPERPNIQGRRMEANVGKESSKAWLAASTGVRASGQKSRAHLSLVPAYSPDSGREAAVAPFWESLVGRLASLRVRMAEARALKLLVQRRDGRLLADAGLAAADRNSFGDDMADIGDRPRWLS